MRSSNAPVIMILHNFSTVQLQTYNLPDHYIGLRNGDQAFINKEAVPKQFKLISPGLCGTTGTISFQSATHPNKYLRHRYFVLHEDPFSDDDLYKKDTCFFLHKDKWFPGHDAFESVNYPRFYIYHLNFRLKLQKYKSVALFEKDASFRPVIPTCYKFTSKSFPAYSWGLRGDAVHIKEASNDSFVMIRPGLGGQAGTVSFRSCTDATKYLMHSNFVMWQRPYHPSLVYKLDATFTIRKNKWFDGFDAYECVNLPLSFIFHQNFRLKITPYDGTPLYKNDSSFKPVPSS